MFKRIILPINKTNKSLKIAKKAVQLAKKLEIKVTAIYTVKQTVFTGTMPTHQAYAYKYHKDIKEEKKEKAHDFLNKIEKIGDEKNVNVQTILLEGNAEEKIINETNENDLIVIEAKGTSTIDRIFLSSLNEKLLHNAPSTVIIFR
jgi:nucleotide-binding universal stress UspA family protein